MDATIFTELSKHTADVIWTADDWTVSQIEMGEMADGSRRHYALIHMIDLGGFEQTYRVTTPAPWNSPAWASVHTDWGVQLRIGEEWVEFEFETA